MITLENAIKETLKKEFKKRANNADFREKHSLLVEIQKIGLLCRQDYTIAPLDTVGRRRFQLSKKG